MWFTLAWKRDEQSGIALLELVIVAPLLFLFSVSAFDVGSLLMHHFFASQVAREGVRRVIGIPALEVGTYTLAEGYGFTTCSSEANTLGGEAPKTCASAPQQQQMLNAVYQMLQNCEQREGLRLIPSSRQVQIQFQQVERMVRVRVSFRYRGFTPIFSDWQVSTSATASYL